MSRWICTLWVSLALVGCADTTAPRFDESAALTLAPEAGRVAITWPAASDDRAVTAYVVVVEGADVARTTSTGYALEGVPELATRHVVVTAIDEAGNRSAPIAGEVTMPDVTPPVFAATASITLTADAPSDDGARVLRAQWTEATDASGPVRYEVSVTGGWQQILTTVDAATFASPSAILLPDQAVSIVALDATGLRSAPMAARWAESTQARDEQIHDALDQRVRDQNAALLRALTRSSSSIDALFGSAPPAVDLFGRPVEGLGVARRRE